MAHTNKTANGMPVEVAESKIRRTVASATHPMWLLIKEDTVCAERIPPWGAPSIAEYSRRLDRNLQSLESTPRAKLNYDFSAAELEDVKALYPALGKRIKAAIQRGQLGIINGTYSQPHLHTFSLEASVRQFAVGTRSILDHFGYQIRTYAMQEPGYTDQTPQILKAFGYRYANRALSGFPTRQKALPGETSTGKEAFCSWRGLDGTEVPAFQSGVGCQVGCPDMDEFRTSPDCDYVVLDEFLDRKFPEEHELRPRLRFYIPWGYIEGTDADKLSRLDTATETALVQLETMMALAQPSNRWPMTLPDLTQMWKIWLLAQHHDAYWTGGPELRAKCCVWLKEVIRKSSEASVEMLKAMFPDHPDGGASLVRFAVYPKKHAGVTKVQWSGSVPECFMGPEGRKLAAQIVPTGPEKGKLFVPFDFYGAGYEELLADGKCQNPCIPEPITSDLQFCNEHFCAFFDTNGGIKNIQTKNGVNLFDGGTSAAILTASLGDSIAYIQDWRIIGPFCSSKEGQINLEMPTPVEDCFAKLGMGVVDMNAEYHFGSETLKWKSLSASAGVIDCDVHIDSAPWACAYGVAEIVWPCDEEVVFGFGSSDGIKVWLNEKIVHIHEGQRGWVLPGCSNFQDKVKLGLRKGINRLLVKIDRYQPGRGYGFGVGIKRNLKNVQFLPSDKACVWKGPVADIFEVSGMIGAIPVTRCFTCYHKLPYFEMELECDFNHASAGDFYDDTSKLVLQWPIREGTAIVQGIGGGSIVPDEPETVFYPVNWLDLADRSGGLAMINFGTRKHLKRDGKLIVVLAWGADTAHFGNRVDNPEGDLKKLDLRLKGKKIFRFVFYPHDGNWRNARVPDLAMSLLRPPVAARQRLPPDRKPTSKTRLALSGNLIPTSVQTDGKHLTCRAYEPDGIKSDLLVNYLGRKVTPQICDVAGHPLKELRAWGIVNLIVG